MLANYYKNSSRRKIIQESKSLYLEFRDDLKTSKSGHDDIELPLILTKFGQ